MKNIHILPTDKLSKLYVRNDVTPPFYSNFQGKPQNIYITSDEDISGFENNIWVILGTRVFLWKNTMALVLNNKPKKIILTTDPDLIADCVQKIDDEFLEWFIKNSRCKSIEVIEDIIDSKNSLEFTPLFGYRIIIPKEETICIQTGLPCGMTCFSEEVCNRNVYTEEDVKNAFLDGWQLRDGDLPFPKAKKKWFNKFKKK